MTTTGQASAAPVAAGQNLSSRHGLYLGSIAAGALASVAFVLAFFMLLDHDSRLPPPPIVNNLCADEKLLFLRQHTFDSPTVLVLGSSIAWRSVDSASVSKATGGLRTFNGSFCALHMNQTEFVGGWLLDRLPSVRAVIVVASPFDFVGCNVSPTELFNRQAADDFVFERKWKWTFYFRYFEPVSMMRNALHVGALRSNSNPFQSLVFTKFGDGPIDTDRPFPELTYGKVPEFDRTCFAALTTFAKRLASENRTLAVVTTPLNPEWKKRFDPDDKVGGQLGRAIVEALQQTNAQYWDGDANIPMGPEAFADAIHLRWSAAKTFSGTFAHALAGYLVPSRASQADLTQLAR